MSFAKDQVPAANRRLLRQQRPVRPPVEFGPKGGTIGRSTSNTLVLDGRERAVSRLQVQIECSENQ